MSTVMMTLREVIEKVKPGKTIIDAATQALEQERVEAGDHKSPWFVRALVAVSAWMASIMFLVFVYGARIISSSMGSVVLGAVLIAFAVFLRRAQKNNLFLAQLALAMSLAGQALLIMGIGEKMRTAGAALTAIGMSIALIVLYPDKTHRFLSTLIAINAAVIFVYDQHIPYGLQVLVVGLAGAAGHVWHYESSLAAGRMAPVLRPVAYGMIVGMFLLLIPSGLPPDLRMHVRVTHTWFPVTIALAILLMLLEYRLLSFHKALGEKQLTLIVFGGALVLAVASLKAPGIIAALFVLALGFHRGNSIITSVALAFLAVFLSAYYYNLNITLLNKSYTLLAVGTVLLALRPLLSSALQNSNKEAAHG
jgi:uncharacterized membrane protein